MEFKKIAAYVLIFGLILGNISLQAGNVVMETYVNGNGKAYTPGHLAKQIQPVQQVQLYQENIPQEDQNQQVNNERDAETGIMPTFSNGFELNVAPEEQKENTTEKTEEGLLESVWNGIKTGLLSVPAAVIGSFLWSKLTGRQTAAPTSLMGSVASSFKAMPSSILLSAAADTVVNDGNFVDSLKSSVKNQLGYKEGQSSEWKAWRNAIVKTVSSTLAATSGIMAINYILKK
jgi:hypothetical protein